MFIVKNKGNKFERKLVMDMIDVEDLTYNICIVDLNKYYTYVTIYLCFIHKYGCYVYR